VLISWDYPFNIKHQMSTELELHSVAAPAMCKSREIPLNR
jgi:hypothetical protein